MSAIIHEICFSVEQYKFPEIPTNNGGLFFGNDDRLFSEDEVF